MAQAKNELDSPCFWWSRGHEAQRGFVRTPCEQMITTMLWCNYLLHGRRVNHPEEIDNPAFKEHIRELLHFIFYEQGRASEEAEESKTLPAGMQGSKQLQQRRHCKVLQTGEVNPGYPVDIKSVKGVSLGQLDLYQQLHRSPKGPKHMPTKTEEQYKINMLQTFNDRPYWEYHLHAAQPGDDASLGQKRSGDVEDGDEDGIALLSKEDAAGFRRFCAVVSELLQSNVLIPCSDVAEEAWLSTRGSEDAPNVSSAMDADGLTTPHSAGADQPNPDRATRSDGEEEDQTSRQHRTYAEFMSPEPVPIDFRGQPVCRGSSRLYWVDLRAVRFKHSKIVNEGDIEMLKEKQQPAGGAGRRKKTTLAAEQEEEEVEVEGEEEGEGADYT
eukprot:1616033-Rhodomonas_salina.1